ncbi:hypothetical protein BDDG_13520, partial [Blastomyces dermatitidis ATCC 18188]
HTIMNDTSSLSSYTLLIIFFSVKSSRVDRFTFTDNSELSVESLIENLKNVIMKKLSVSCIAESPVFLSASSAASSPAALSQSSTLAPVSDSPASATPVPVISTLTTSDFTVSVFITSSSCFKKMLHRLSELYFSRIISLLNSIKIINIYVFRNRNTDIILFYTHRYKTYMP